MLFASSSTGRNACVVSPLMALNGSNHQPSQPTNQPVSQQTTSAIRTATHMAIAGIVLFVMPYMAGTCVGRHHQQQTTVAAPRIVDANRKSLTCTYQTNNLLSCGRLALLCVAQVNQHQPGNNANLRALLAHMAGTNIAIALTLTWLAN